MKESMYMTRPYRRELLSEWWAIKVALRVLSGHYETTSYLRARQRLIERMFKRKPITKYS